MNSYRFGITESVKLLASVQIKIDCEYNLLKNNLLMDQLDRSNVAEIYERIQLHSNQLVRISAVMSKIKTNITEEEYCSEIKSLATDLNEELADLFESDLEKAKEIIGEQNTQ